MKKVFAFLIVVAFFSLDASRLNKKHTTKVSKQPATAEYAIVVDAETNECLFGEKEDEKCFPSSMTKLMTLYLLFSEISEGRIKLNDELPVSKTAQKMKGSRSFFQAGTTAKIEDLIRSIVVHSGNDACVVVAEGIAGDIDAFVKEMNKKAKEFELKNTNFMNPTGMPDENHFSCARDLATISKRIIYDFPQFYHYFSEKTFTINSITQDNRNTLLGNSLKIDGLKTGKTDSGGYGIAISAENYGKRLIVVVNGCKSAKARSQYANKLLAFGFKEFVPLKIAKTKNPISEISVWSGVKDKVQLCTHENIVVLIPEKYKKSLKVEIKIKEPVEAPVTAGIKLGELIYKYGNFISKKYDIFACEPVEKAGFFHIMKLSLQRLISGNKKKACETTVDVQIPLN